MSGRYGGSDRGYGGGGGGRYNDRGGDRRDYGRGYNDRSRGYGGNQQRGGRDGNSGAGGGAAHLARIHGTEEDRVNCPFYYKIGACRHGDRCSRMHNKPLFSQTLLIHHIYENPLAKVIAENGDPTTLNRASCEAEFEDFYEEMFEELCNYGHLEQLNVMDNLGEHLLGAVYVKFTDEEHTAAAHKALYGRFYRGKPIICEYSPVTDFRESRCRQFDDGTCNRGGYCNFMHIKTIPREMSRDFEVLYNTKKEDASDDSSSSGSSSDSDKSDDGARRKKRKKKRKKKHKHRKSRRKDYSSQEEGEASD